MMMELGGTGAGSINRSSWLDWSESLQARWWSHGITLVESDFAESRPLITRFMVAWFMGRQMSCTK